MEIAGMPSCIGTFASVEFSTSRAANPTVFDAASAAWTIRATLIRAPSGPISDAFDSHRHRVLLFRARVLRRDRLLHDLLNRPLQLSESRLIRRPEVNLHPGLLGDGVHAFRRQSGRR